MSEDYVQWAGRLLRGISPLALALVFYGLFAFFGARAGLDVTTWNGADHGAIEATDRLKTTADAVAKAKDAVFRLQDPKLAAEAALKTAQEARDVVKTVVEKQSVSKTTSELTVRLFWLIACIVFSFLMVLVGIQAIRAIDDMLRREAASPDRDSQLRQPRALTALVLASLICWLTLLLLHGEDLTSKAGGLPATELLRNLQGGDTGLAPTVSEAFAKVPHLGLMLNFMNAGALVVILLVALSVSAVVSQLQEKQRLLEADTNMKRDKKDLEGDARWLRETRDKTAPLMQLTAFALIAGVIEVLLLYLLASHHVRATLQPDARLFAQVIALAGGMVYSGILMAIYLPLYDAVKSFGTLLAARLGAPAGSSTALTPESVFEIIPIPIAKSVLLLLSPVMAALAGGLIGTLQDILVRWMQ